MKRTQSTRRHFLRQLTASAAAVASLPVAAAPASDSPGFIDTHTHFYDPTRPQGVPWPDAKSPLYRTVLPADWKVLAAPHGVTHTVVVEASKLLEDNQWMLDLAAREAAIVGFVGNVPPSTPDFAGHLKRLAANPIFRGIRINGKTLQTDADKPEFLSAMRLLSELGLSLDVVGSPDMLLAVGSLSKQLPDLRIVINHVGGAGAPDKLSDTWKDGMKQAAQGRGVFCKVSGLPEQSGAKVWGTASKDPAFYAPIMDHLWDCFGEDRLVYGSNWPVSDRGVAYADVFKIVDTYFTAKGASARQKYFRENSQVAYRWIAR